MSLMIIIMMTMMRFPIISQVSQLSHAWYYQTWQCVDGQHERGQEGKGQGSQWDPGVTHQLLHGVKERRGVEQRLAETFSSEIYSETQWSYCLCRLLNREKQSRSRMYLCLGWLSFNRCGPFDITLEVFIAFCPLSSVVYLWFSCEVTYCTCVNTCSHMEVHVERYGVKHSFQTSIRFALNIVLLFFFNGGFTFTMGICSCIKKIFVSI